MTKRLKPGKEVAELHAVESLLLIQRDQKNSSLSGTIILQVSREAREALNAAAWYRAYLERV